MFSSIFSKRWTIDIFKIYLKNSNIENSNPNPRYVFVVTFSHLVLLPSTCDNLLNARHCDLKNSTGCSWLLKLWLSSSFLQQLLHVTGWGSENVPPWGLWNLNLVLLTPLKRIPGWIKSKAQTKIYLKTEKWCPSQRQVCPHLSKKRTQRTHPGLSFSKN